jgi:hemerythrin superfamily protein
MAAATANTKPRKTAKTRGARAATAAESTKSAGADQLLKADHRSVEKLFRQYEQATESANKRELARTICTELVVHSQLEESHFYPACREKNVESALLDEAQVEHDVAKILIAEIMTLPPESAAYDAKIKVLSEYVKHHVGEEENSSSGIIAKARKAGVDMKALGNVLVSRKQELMAKARAGDLPCPHPARSRSARNRQIQIFRRTKQWHSEAIRIANATSKDALRVTTTAGFRAEAAVMDAAATMTTIAAGADGLRPVRSATNMAAS